MLIVCPSCSTSYMIEPASLGPAGRTVRCARCRETWFAHPPEADEPVDAFVDGVIAEARMDERRPAPPRPQPAPEPPSPRNDYWDDPREDRAGESQQTVQMAESPSLVPAISEAHEHDEPAARAEPVVTPAEDARPPLDHMPLPEPAGQPPAEELESFVARRRRLTSRREKARRSSRWTAIVLVLLALNVALIGARSEVVRFLPQTASLFAAIGLPVNLRQLVFEDVRVTREAQSGTPMLSIEGKIVSKASKPVEVPRLRFAARNAEGREVYSWTARPERKTLAAGESLVFRSFAKPPDDAVDIMVRFFNAQDATGGM